MRQIDPNQTPTIEMTLSGDVLPPPTFWSKARAIWRVLPPGTTPALIVTIILFLAAAIFLVGLLIVAIPVLLALAVIGLVLRATATPRARPPTTR